MSLLVTAADSQIEYDRSKKWQNDLLELACTVKRPLATLNTARIASRPWCLPPVLSFPRAVRLPLLETVARCVDILDMRLYSPRLYRRLVCIYVPNVFVDQWLPIFRGDVFEDRCQVGRSAIKVVWQQGVNGLWIVI